MYISVYILCVCVCVFIYIYIYIYVYVFIYICVVIYIYIYIYIYMNTDLESWNCRNKEEYPLGGCCNSRNIVYQAYISPMEQQRDGERESI